MGSFSENKPVFEEVLGRYGTSELLFARLLGGSLSPLTAKMMVFMSDSQFRNSNSRWDEGSGRSAEGRTTGWRRSWKVQRGNGIVPESS